MPTYLSPHFTLEELTRTDVRDLPNTPGEAELAALRVLCVEFLEPVRSRFGGLRIHSGFRSEAVNARIGGAVRSSHRHGCAADFDPMVPGITNAQVLRWVRDESGLVVDQVIDEESSRGPPGWVHLGITPPWATRARLQFLQFRGGVYTPFPK